MRTNLLLFEDSGWRQLLPLTWLRPAFELRCGVDRLLDKVVTHLSPLVLQAAAGKREHITIFGTDYSTPDGTCIRDYIHVADLAEAHLLAVEALADRSVRYNLGNGTGCSVREVIAAAERVTGRTVPHVIGPRRAGDPPVLVASSRRIREELGWAPRHPDLETIIAHAWAWRQAHPDGYGRKEAALCGGPDRR